MMTKTDILQALKDEIAQETGLSPEEISDEASFFSLGLNSISAVYILDTLERKLKIPMNPMFFWDYPTVRLFAEHLAKQNHE